MEKIRVTCIAYNVAKNILAGLCRLPMLVDYMILAKIDTLHVTGGTDSGHVLMWRFRSKAAQGSETAWEVRCEAFWRTITGSHFGEQLLPKVNAGGNVENVSWGRLVILTSGRRGLTNT